MIGNYFYNDYAIECHWKYIFKATILLISGVMFYAVLSSNISSQWAVSTLQRIVSNLVPYS